MYRQVFVGSMIHANENKQVIFKEKVGIFVENGKIIDVVENPDAQRIANFKPNKIDNLSQEQFMIPGFIDCHTCAMQFPNLGLGYDKTFLDWLETYIFPLEKQYNNEMLATFTFDVFVRRIVQAGTTTACYYASMNKEASVVLAQICSKFGQRAFVGKINMNAPRNDGYYESTENSIQNTRAFIEAVERLRNPLVKPIITPRFALSCNMELMQQLAAIAVEKNLHIQSTISQSKIEVQAVKEKFEKATYADVYDTAGLLTNKTILAHGTHLEISELDVLANKGTAIIHCPTSDINLKSGLCDVRRLMIHNIDVGLGTDISGGSHYCMLNAMRAALNTSIVLSLTGSNNVPLDYKDVFYMATLGNAKVLKIDDKVGNFYQNKEFDALVINLITECSLLDDFKKYTLEERFQRFIYCGTFHNIESVYIKGRKVK